MHHQPSLNFLHLKQNKTLLPGSCL
jgi:hypothetical protein